MFDVNSKILCETTEKPRKQCQYFVDVGPGI